MTRTAMLLLALLLAGCAGGSAEEKTWHGRDLTDPAWRQQRLEPGESLRYDTQILAPKALEWDWFVNERTPLTFGLHQHASQGYTTHEQVQAEQDQGTYQARAGPYSFTWTNEASTPATLWWQGPSGGYMTRYDPGQDPVADECPPMSLC